jgi:hypothetical protein
MAGVDPAIQVLISAGEICGCPGRRPGMTTQV